MQAKKHVQRRGQKGKLRVEFYARLLRAMLKGSTRTLKHALQKARERGDRVGAVLATNNLNAFIKHPRFKRVLECALRPPEFLNPAEATPSAVAKCLLPEKTSKGYAYELAMLMRAIASLSPDEKKLLEQKVSELESASSQKTKGAKKAAETKQKTEAKAKKQKPESKSAGCGGCDKDPAELYAEKLLTAVLLALEGKNQEAKSVYSAVPKRYRKALSTALAALGVCAPERAKALLSVLSRPTGLAVAHLPKKFELDQKTCEIKSIAHVSAKVAEVANRLLPALLELAKNATKTQPAQSQAPAKAQSPAKEPQSPAKGGKEVLRSVKFTKDGVWIELAYKDTLVRVFIGKDGGVSFGVSKAKT